MFRLFPHEKEIVKTQKSLSNMASNDSQIDTPQRGRPKRAELPDVNINTGVQSINTESLFNIQYPHQLSVDTESTVFQC